MVRGEGGVEGRVGSLGFRGGLMVRGEGGVEGRVGRRRLQTLSSISRLIIPALHPVNVLVFVTSGTENRKVYLTM